MLGKRALNARKFGGLFTPSVMVSMDEEEKEEEEAEGLRLSPN